MIRTKMGFCKFKLENYPYQFKEIRADLELDSASPKLKGVTPGGCQLRRGRVAAHEVDGGEQRSWMSNRTPRGFHGVDRPT